MNGDPQNDGLVTDPSAGVEKTAEERRIAARRRFLCQGAAAGSGVLIYTIPHSRSFGKPKEDHGSKKVLVSSPAACASVGGSEAKKKKVVDSVNPVAKIDKKTGLPKRDKDDNIIYEETKVVYECKVKK